MAKREKRKTLKSYIYERDGRRCRYCEKPLRFTQATLDHYRPLSRGGPDALYNMVLSCRRCNRSKGDNLPADWEETMLGLFKLTARDDKLTVAFGNIHKEKLRAVIARLDRVEDLHRETVLQGGGYRLTVREHNLLSLKRISAQGEESP